MDNDIPPTHTIVIYFTICSISASLTSWGIIGLWTTLGEGDIQLYYYVL